MQPRRSGGLLLVGVFWALCLPAGAAWAAEPAGRTIEFNRDIRPILADNCFKCHGPDANKRQADLRLDVKAEATADRGGYRLIVARKLDESELYSRITADDVDERMPPPQSGKTLTAAQIELIRRWIEQGGAWKSHWSLVGPQRAQPPAILRESWPRGAIDRFILARLEREGLVPSPEADRRTLIRRLSQDLTGLPPTPEEVDSFVADNRDAAYEALVDRLLATDAYGERMAMDWLDLVRFADTNGIHGDNHREHAPYRDYVIDAFNTNKPFDRFTIEQLAGDLLPDATNEQKIASGYNRLNMTTREGGAQAKEYRAKYAADRVRNFSTVWLGATIGCSECHDHKFDPYTMKDFYSLAAFFADLQETAVGVQKPAKLLTPRQMDQIQRIQRRIEPLEKLAESEEARNELAELKKKKQQIEQAAAPILISMSVTPRVTRVLPRGNWLDDSGQIVSPAAPAFMTPMDVGGPRANRLDLARWLVASENPVAARVVVNRLWKLAFGRGIVNSLGDFGSQGAAPTHPRLLDWLAVELIESGWDIKHILKRIVMSSAYRQSSRETDLLRQRDPYNQWLARQGRHRLGAEMIRDGALAVSGLLVTKVGGASVKPYQPAGYWAHLNFPKRVYQPDAGENQYRRGLYTYWARTFLHPSLLAFDAPSREECTVERPRSNTPLAALVLLNDPTYVEAARVFAERIVRQGGPNTGQRIQFAYRLALSRRASDDEAMLLTDLVQQHRREYEADHEAAKALVAVGQRPATSDIDPVELAAWTSVARVILNLHETITRN